MKWKSKKVGQRGGPKMIVGDINGNLESFPTIQDLLDNHGWTDIGL